MQNPIPSRPQPALHHTANARQITFSDGPFNNVIDDAQNIPMMPNGSVGFNAAPQPQIPTQMQQGMSAQGTIPLSVLIDFVVQKTYHEITVMADLLPGKNDQGRKTTIVNFCSKTRQLFIRILALVKWASSVTKVVRCSDISTFLDRQVCTTLSKYY